MCQVRPALGDAAEGCRCRFHRPSGPDMDALLRPRAAHLPRGELRQAVPAHLRLQQPVPRELPHSQSSCATELLRSTGPLGLSVPSPGAPAGRSGTGGAGPASPLQQRAGGGAEAAAGAPGRAPAGGAGGPPVVTGLPGAPVDLGADTPLWFAANWAYNASLGSLTVTTSTVVSSTSCIWVYLLAALFGVEAPSRRRALGVALCVAGSVCDALSGAQGGGGEGRRAARRDGGGSPDHLALWPRSAAQSFWLRFPLAENGHEARRSHFLRASDLWERLRRRQKPAPIPVGSLLARGRSSLAWGSSRPRSPRRPCCWASCAPGRTWAG
ncbi:unnamed protein product [Prorocentrum cordatum]|uniref:EamA domain-containing protein n=1 Tax=Prorocentrum cordatum TaxID=2364126 RepID=A0ABN9QWJ0_9DINO|nr:unnamed protein product [Polarella glacialis]